MPNPENIKSYKWKPGESGNKRGRPHGILNRATIARKVLLMRADPPEEILAELHELYPKLRKRLSVEEVITLVLAAKAVMDGDTQAYKALMDSAYGRPQLDVTSDGSRIQGEIQINVETPEQASELKKFIEYVRGLN
jgi:hypothetical protein